MMIDLPQRCFIGRVNPKWFARVRPLYLNYTASTPLSDYQVRCLLTPHDIAFERLRPDKRDLLFIDENNEVIPYWIERANSSELVVWLKFSRIEAGREIFWLYYGNGYFTGASNGEAVFEFFDDFETFNEDEWEKESGSLTIVSDPADSGRGNVLKFDGEGSWYAFRKTTYTFTDGIIEFEFYRPENAKLQFIFRVSALGSSRTFYEFESENDGDLDFQKFVNGTETANMNPQAAGITGDEWHSGKIIAVGSYFEYWVDGVHWITQTDTSISSGNLGGRAPGIIYFNDLRVRKYTEIEPFISL
ncbi:MAG: hypothetical protein DRP09_21895 [Candidatus Thorarchaeota archaeon]|nr:MAG: hypothetical protein DRP09_21895 [Candidatus Thorarchaeota archaeon]